MKLMKPVPTFSMISFLRLECALLSICSGPDELLNAGTQHNCQAPYDADGQQHVRLGSVFFLLTRTRELV